MIQPIDQLARRSTKKPVKGSKPAETMEPQYTAPALEKGLDILELLAGEAEGLSQGTIAQRLGRSTAELFRMISVLERRGYLSRHADSSYRASSRVLSAFQSALAQDALIEELVANSTKRITASKVRADLAKVVDKGYYMAPSDTTLGVTDLSAPIFDHSDGAVASLTVPYLHQRDVHVSIEETRDALLTTVRQISAALGAPPSRR